MAYLFPLATALVALVTFLYFYKWHTLRHRAQQHASYIPPLYAHTDLLFGLDFFIISVRAFLNFTRLPVSAATFERHGPTYAVRRFGGYQSLETCDYANIRAVWADRSGSWGVAPTRLAPMEPFCGRGFIDADGTDWQTSRGLVKMSLRREDVLDLKPFKEVLGLFFEKLPEDGETVDLQPWLSKLFLDTATQFLLGDSAGTLAGVAPAGMDDFVAAFNSGMQGCGLRFVLGPLMGLSRWTNFAQSCTTTQAFVEQYIDRALALRDKAGEDAPEADTANAHGRLRRTLLWRMADQTRHRIFMRTNIIQALMATLDTTSEVITNALWELARRPDVYRALRDEVQGAAKGDDEFLDVATLQALPLLRAILHESLRLHPPIPILNRIALRDTTVPRGGGHAGDEPVFVPEGAVINVHWHVMHRSAEGWAGVADPKRGGDDKSDRASLSLNEFHPARWQGLAPSSVPYMPFGLGPKRCLGQDKALLEASCVIAEVVRRYQRIEPRDERPYAAKVALTAASAHGCLVALYKA